MSRICIKGLSKTITEQELRDIFSSKGEITDTRIMRTKSGVSRRFAFIGYRTEQEAQAAIKYFNNSYITTCKITVEPANKHDTNTKRDPSNNAYSNIEEVQTKLTDTMTKLANVKSKYSKSKLERMLAEMKSMFGASTHETALNGKSKEKSKSMKQGEDTPTSNEIKEKGKIADESRELREFKQVMKSRRQGKVWGNDEGDPARDDRDNEKPMVEDEDSDSSSVNDMAVDNTSYEDMLESGEDNESDTDSPKTMKNEHLSDMDFLKSKITKQFSDEKPAESENRSTVRRLYEDIQVKGKEEIPSTEKHHQEDKITRDESFDDTGRLFVRNLPFTVTEDDLKEIFEPFGQISEIHIPIGNDKKGKGFSFVQFLFPEHAVKAINGMDGTSFQGRLLHIIPAQSPREQASFDPSLQGRKLSSYQQKKEEERRKQINKKEGWNSSYVRSDTVVESLAERYGIKASNIVDTNEKAGELAVRLAIAETQIIQENREYLATHGVNIEVLESGHSTNKSAARSTTTLLVKNLPHDMNPEELESMFAKYGNISAFLVPKSKTIVVIDFVESAEAKAAFKGLAYRSYHKQPLYLEWASIDLLDKKKAASKMKSLNSNSSSKFNSSVESSVDLLGDDNLDDYSTLFVKNLNFTTSEDTIREYIQDKLRLPGLRAISIQKKPKGNEVISLGYGFVEFRNNTFAMQAIDKLNKLVIDGHALEVKPSDKRLSKAPVTASGQLNNNRSTKLVIRNVPFQATQHEIRSLFSSFGTVKSVRIPKKMAGLHRGFAFIDFSTHQEAQTAMSSLGSTHLYGRHLVIEWAKDDDEDLDVLRKRAQEQEKVIQNEGKRRKLDDYDGIDSGLGSRGISIGKKNRDDFDDDD